MPVKLVSNIVIFLAKQRKRLGLMLRIPYVLFFAIYLVNLFGLDGYRGSIYDIFTITRAHFHLIGVVGVGPVTK